MEFGERLGTNMQVSLTMWSDVTSSKNRSDTGKHCFSLQVDEAMQWMWHWLWSFRCCHLKKILFYIVFAIAGLLRNTSWNDAGAFIIKMDILALLESFNPPTFWSKGQLATYQSQLQKMLAKSHSLNWFLSPFKQRDILQIWEGAVYPLLRTLPMHS